MNFLDSYFISSKFIDAYADNWFKDKQVIPFSQIGIYDDTTQKTLTNALQIYLSYFLLWDDYSQERLERFKLLAADAFFGHGKFRPDTEANLINEAYSISETKKDNILYQKIFKKKYQFSCLITLLNCSKDSNVSNCYEKILKTYSHMLIYKEKIFLPQADNFDDKAVLYSAVEDYCKEVYCYSKIDYKDEYAYFYRDVAELERCLNDPQLSHYFSDYTITIETLSGCFDHD